MLLRIMQAISTGASWVCAVKTHFAVKSMTTYLDSHETAIYRNPHSSSFT